MSTDYKVKDVSHADFGRKELDVAEVYNPFTFQEMLFYECFGFCGLGESPDLVLKGTFNRTGELPCDPSGGVLCTNPKHKQRQG